MKLLWSSRSPFARKAMVAAHTVGVADRIVTERVVVTAGKSNPDVMAVNPLNKIPTLVLDDGTTLYGSAVICEYFDSLHDRPRFSQRPGTPRTNCRPRSHLARRAAPSHRVSSALATRRIAAWREPERKAHAASGAHLCPAGFRLR
jgi:glutathione S-transferase